MSSEIEKTLDSLVSNLLSGAAKEAAETQLYQELIKQPELFEKPDNLYFGCVYKLKRSIEQAVKHSAPDAHNYYALVFSNHVFFKYHIEYVIKKYEGLGCSADKSRKIIADYLHLMKTGTLDGRDWNQKNYWVPGFGSQDDWMQLMEALVHLYFGNPERYLLTMMHLGKLGVATLEKGDD